MISSKICCRPFLVDNENKSDEAILSLALVEENRALHSDDHGFIARCKANKVRRKRKVEAFQKLFFNLEHV